jgi:hypothetical protein
MTLPSISSNSRTTQHLQIPRDIHEGASTGHQQMNRTSVAPGHTSSGYVVIYKEISYKERLYVSRITSQSLECRSSSGRTPSLRGHPTPTLQWLPEHWMLVLTLWERPYARTSATPPRRSLQHKAPCTTPMRKGIRLVAVPLVAVQ